MTTPPFSLAGRTALVTGAGSPSGIGMACARLLGRQGARVVLSATTERAEQRAAELRAEGLDAVAMLADLTDREAARTLVDRAAEHLGSLHIVVNNAGMVQTGHPIQSGTFLDQPADDWARQVEITLMTAVNVTRAAIPHLRAAGHGRIIMLSSVTGPLVSMSGSSAYSAAKGGMDGMMRSIAIEEAPYGITCNSVAPGWVATASLEGDELMAADFTPLGRAGTPDEIAAAVGFLASDEASYVTGQPFVVDGGNIIQEKKGPSAP